MVSSFSEWSSRQALITSVNEPPHPTTSLKFLASIGSYGSIITRDFNPSQPITVFLENHNFTLSQSESYINLVLKSSISG